jgi:hypothetical protein
MLGQWWQRSPRFGQHNTCGNNSSTDGRQLGCTQCGCTHQHRYYNDYYDNHHNHNYNNHDYDNDDSRTDHDNVYDYINNIYNGSTDYNHHGSTDDYNIYDGSTDDNHNVNDDNSCTACDHRSVNNNGCSKHNNVNISCAASTSSTSCSQRV